MVAFARLRAGAVTPWRIAVLAVAIVVTFPTLVLARAVIRYDVFSRGRHGAFVREHLSWRRSTWVGPALPLFLLTAPAIGYVGGGRWVHAVTSVLWLGIALGLAEIYSICLHREAWIAAFEPWLLATGSRPLGGAPPCDDDRRLHYLVRVQLLYSVVPVMSGLLLGLNGSRPALLAATCFMAKFFAHASTDYEVSYHWHIHTGALRLAGRPGGTRLVEAALDWYLGPLHGYVPHIYRADHLLIHHPENSGPGDIHSPLPYRRTSLLEFCVFALRTCGAFLFGCQIVNHRRCRSRARRRAVTGVVVFWSTVVLLVGHGRVLGAWLAVLAVHRAVTATRSQYVWHGLSDATRPSDPMASTMLWLPGAPAWSELVARAESVSPPSRSPGTTLTVPAMAHVPSPGTDWAFFDNHHLLHHLHPRAHYWEYPVLLARRMPDMLRHEAVVLDLAGLETFAYDCWSENLTRLSEVLVAPTVADPEAFLNERLAPLAAVRSPYGYLCESSFGRRADHALTRLLGFVTRGRG